MNGEPLFEIVTMMQYTTDTQQKLHASFAKFTALTEKVRQSFAKQEQLLQRLGMLIPPPAAENVNQLSTSIDNLQDALLDEQKELHQLRLLAEMALDITTTLEVDKILRGALWSILQITGAERGYILLQDENGKLVCRLGQEGDQFATIEVNELSGGILQEVVSTGHAVLSHDAPEDQRFADHASVGALNLRSVLCVPLQFKDEIYGVVYVDNRLAAGVFTEREKNLLLAFANTCAVALTNAQYYEQVQQTLTEITDVKDLMDNVFGSLASAVIATDEHNNITIFNRAAEEIFDQSATAVIGSPLDEMFPSSSNQLKSSLTEVQQTQMSSQHETKLEIDAHGQVVVQMRLNPLRDVNQNVHGVAVVMDDVTERLEREQQLRMMRTYLPPKMVDEIHTISNLALGGERRDITCLFLDVLPPDNLEVILSPHDLMTTLNELFALATRCVHEHNGLVDKYMGTEMMVLFNTQLNPLEYHAENAMRVALQFRELATTHYEKVIAGKGSYRMGVHSGVATIGNVGGMNRRAFTAIGDTVNLAKRLEESAEPNQILLTRETFDRISSQHLSFPHKALPALQMKGRQQLTDVVAVE